MKKLKVLVLLHKDAIPPPHLNQLTPQKKLDFKTEKDVLSGLKKLGHDVQVLGILDDLSVIRQEVTRWDPDITFNLLDEFDSIPTYDQNIVGYLELMRRTYTGCNPKGLMLARDKPLAKKILTFHHIRVPKFVVFPIGKKMHRPKRIDFPLLVKSVHEEASLGISQASVVYNDEKLKERIQFIHEQILTDALVEEYVEGRELYVGVVGNQRLQTFPIWELLFKKMPEDMPRIATYRVKWNVKYQKKYGIDNRRAKGLEPKLDSHIHQICKKAYQVLKLSGYARIDLRLREDGTVFLLEANPNPDIGKDEDFSASAKESGLSYENLLQRIINLGLQYRVEWKV